MHQAQKHVLLEKMKLTLTNKYIYIQSNNTTSSTLLLKFTPSAFDAFDVDDGPPGWQVRIDFTLKLFIR